MILNRKSVFVIFVVGLALVITLLCKPYNDIDDYYLSMIGNGLFSSDNYCIFIHPLFTSAICYLHQCFPAIDFYLLFIRFFYLFAIGILANRLYTLKISRRHSLICIGLIIPLSFVNQNYTIFTAFLISCGLFLTFTHESNYGKADFVCSLLIVAFGCLLRRNVILLSLPFWACESLFNIKIRQKRKSPTNSLHKYHKEVALAFIILSLLFTSLLVEVTNPNNFYGAQYNQARTATYDYPMLVWNNVEQHNTIGLTKNDYNSLIQDGLYGDTDTINIGYLENIVKLGSNQFDFSHSGLHNSIKRIIRSSFSEVFFFPVLFVCLLLYFFVMLNHIPILDKIKCSLIILGAITICFFFAFKGRLPGRVTISIMILCSFPFLCSIERNKFILQKNSSTKRRKTLCFATAIAILSCACCLLQIADHFILLHRQQQTDLVFTSNENDLYSPNKDDVFVWNTLHHYQEAAIASTERGLLPTEEQMQHHIDYNFWGYGQPYMKDYLERLGVPNPIKALLERPHTYLVAYDQTYVETYLQEHYDKQTKAIQIGTINSVPVWSFQQ